MTIFDMDPTPWKEEWEQFWESFSLPDSSGHGTLGEPDPLPLPAELAEVEKHQLAHLYARAPSEYDAVNEMARMLKIKDPAHLEYEVVQSGMEGIVVIQSKELFPVDASGNWTGGPGYRMDDDGYAIGLDIETESSTTAIVESSGLVGQTRSSFAQMLKDPSSGSFVGDNDLTMERAMYLLQRGMFDSLFQGELAAVAKRAGPYPGLTTFQLVEANPIAFDVIVEACPIIEAPMESLPWRVPDGVVWVLLDGEPAMVRCSLPFDRTTYYPGPGDTSRDRYVSGVEPLTMGQLYVELATSTAINIAEGHHVASPPDLTQYALPKPEAQTSQP